MCEWVDVFFSKHKCSIGTRILVAHAVIYEETIVYIYFINVYLKIPAYELIKL